MTHSGSLPNRVAEWHPLYLPIALDQSGIMAIKIIKKGICQGFVAKLKLNTAYRLFE